MQWGIPRLVLEKQTKCFTNIWCNTGQPAPWGKTQQSTGIWRSSGTPQETALCTATYRLVLCQSWKKASLQTNLSHERGESLNLCGQRVVSFAPTLHLARHSSTVDWRSTRKNSEILFHFLFWFFVLKRFRMKCDITATNIFKQTMLYWTDFTPLSGSEVSLRKGNNSFGNTP